MNPLEQRVARLEALFAALSKSDRYTIEKLLQILDGRNIQLGTGTGTKFGTSASEKLAFYNATPVIQPTAVSDPSGATIDQDAEARAQLIALLTRLRTLGLIAT